MKKCMAFFFYQLELFWQEATLLYQGGFFFLLISLTMGILFPDMSVEGAMKAYFLITIFTLFLMTEYLWKMPYSQGMFDTFRFYPLSMMEIVITYYIVYLFNIIFPLIILNAVALSFLYANKLGLIISYTAVLSIVLMALLLLIFLVQAVILMAKKKAKFLAILLIIPLAIPWIIFSFSFLFQGESIGALLAGLYLIYLPCTLWGATWALRQVYT